MKIKHSSVQLKSFENEYVYVMYVCMYVCMYGYVLCTTPTYCTYIHTYMHWYIGAQEESSCVPGQSDEREQGAAGEDRRARRHAGRHPRGQERHPTQPSGA